VIVIDTDVICKSVTDAGLPLPDASNMPKKPVVYLSPGDNKLNELSDVGKVAGFHKNVDRPASVGSAIHQQC